MMLLHTTPPASPLAGAAKHNHVATPRCVSRLPTRRSVFERCFQQQTRRQRVRASANSSDSENSADVAAPAGVAAIKVKQEATSPFLDPLVRSLFLGVGAGIACETLHVVTKALSLVETGSLLKPFSNDVILQFTPAFVADHTVAIGAWVLLYAVEAAAIMSLINRNPDKANNDQELTTALSALPSRRIFPASLTPVKDALAHTLAAGATAAAIGAAHPARSTSTAVSNNVAEQLAAAAAAPAQLVASPPGLSRELEKTLDDIEQQAAAGGGATSSSTPTPTITPNKKKASPAPPPIKTKEVLRRQQQQQEQQVEEAKRGLSKRDKELRDRKSYLKNFWYAAALSQNVKDKPLGVDILGSRISLFRDEAGKVVAVDDTCPHRGAPLSDGWTATDKTTGKKCIVCPYHGWAFSSDGKLRDVPSAEHGSWPRRPLIGSYDVEERGGFVWLFYGSKSMPASERPPIPTTPELEDPQWRAVYGEIEFDCGHWGAFENAIDMAHIHYLHADSFGNSEKPKVMEMQSTRDTFETICTFRIHNKPVNKMWEWTAVPSVPVTAKAMLPSTSAVTIELAHGVKMITFVNTVPVSENKAINRFCLIRNFATSPAFDFMARDNMYKILGEDKVMVDKLAPERLEVEYSLGPDLPQIAFRQLRQEWIDMGYGVPPESELPRRGLLPRDC